MSIIFLPRLWITLSLVFGHYGCDNRHILILTYSERVHENLSEVATQKENHKLVFKTEYHLMQVKGNTECSKGSIQ